MENRDEEFARARDAALAMLSRSPRSRREIEDRLGEKGFGCDSVKRAVALMIKCNYVNDAEYARDYVKSRIAAGNYGPYRVRAELRAKGIDAEQIEDALTQSSEDYDEAEAVRALLLRKRIDAGEIDRSERKRIEEMLGRRGFSFQAIKEALRVE